MEIWVAASVLAWRMLRQTRHISVGTRVMRRELVNTLGEVAHSRRSIYLDVDLFERKRNMA